MQTTRRGPDPAAEQARSASMAGRVVDASVSGRLDPQVLEVLADGTRRRLLAVLAGAAGPLSVVELSERVELHPNTVRAHVDLLRSIDAVEAVVDPPRGRGRPTHRYRLADRAVDALRRLTEAQCGAGFDARLDGPEDGVWSLRFEGCPLHREGADRADAPCEVHEALLDAQCEAAGLRLVALDADGPCRATIRPDPIPVPTDSSQEATP